MTLVAVNNVFFRGGEGRLSPNVAKNGFTLAPDGFKGWTGSPPMRGDDTPIPQGHGSFDVPLWSTPRMLTLSGVCYAESEGQLEAFGERLSGLADGSRLKVSVSHAGMETWGWARVSSAQFDVTLTGRQALYTIVFKFPNPRRYGRPLLAGSGSSVVIVNRGNFPATGVFEIAGSAPGYVLIGPDLKQYAVIKPLVAGHPHTIDMFTGLLSADGVNQTEAVSVAQTWAFPPSKPIVSVLTFASGSGTIASVKGFDTYK